jgi:hypothetical protein
MKWFNWLSGSHIQYQTPKKEPEKKIQDLSLDERAKSLSGDIFSDIQDRMNCFRFYRAGLNANQASCALVIARQIVEEVEEDYAARKRLGL